MRINLVQLLFEGGPPPQTAKPTAKPAAAKTAKGVQKINQREKSACLKNVKAANLYTKCMTALKEVSLREFKGDAALAILLSIISVESRCNINVADSSYGGVGLMQLTPNALIEINFTGDVRDPLQNIIAGIKYVNFISLKFLSKEKDIRVKNRYAAGGYLDRVAWIMLAYNNGYYAAKRELIKGTLAKDTHYYNDVNAFYQYWALASVLDDLKESAKEKEKKKTDGQNTPNTNSAIKTESINLLTTYIKQLLI